MLLSELVGGSCACDEDGRGKFGVRIQLQAKFDDVVIFEICAGFTASDNNATVGNARMVGLKLIHRDKFNRGVVVGKVVWHSLDFIFNSCLVSAVFCHNVAVASVLFTSSESGIFAASDSFNCLVNGNCVLTGINYAFNSTDSVAMPLTHALAPEGVIATVGQNRSANHSIKREETGVPTCRNDCHCVALHSGCINCRKMLGNASVGVKAVYNIKLFSKSRGLNGKVCRRASTKNHNVDFISHALHVVYRENLGVCKYSLNAIGCSARENSHKRHILVLLYSTFNATAEIAVAVYTNFNHNNLQKREPTSDCPIGKQDIGPIF